MQTDPESTPRKAGFRAEQINVVTPTVDSVPPHGTSPLRGKPLCGLSKLPYRRRQLSRRGLNLSAPPGGFKLAAPCGADDYKFHLAECQMKHFATRRQAR